MSADVVLSEKAPNERPAGIERRSAVRYRIVQRCLVRPAGASGPGSWHGIAYNISATGIGVALAYPLPNGTLLTIEPWGKQSARPVQARVVHSSLVSFLLFHGCELMEPLKDHELRAWIS